MLNQELIQDIIVLVIMTVGATLAGFLSRKSDKHTDKKIENMTKNYQNSIDKIENKVNKLEENLTVIANDIISIKHEMQIDGEDSQLINKLMDTILYYNSSIKNDALKQAMSCVCSKYLQACRTILDEISLTTGDFNKIISTYETVHNGVKLYLHNVLGKFADKYIQEYEKLYHYFIDDLANIIFDAKNQSKPRFIDANISFIKTMNQLAVSIEETML